MSFYLFTARTSSMTSLLRSHAARTQLAQPLNWLLCGQYNMHNNGSSGRSEVVHYDVGWRLLEFFTQPAKAVSTSVKQCFEYSMVKIDFSLDLIEQGSFVFDVMSINRYERNRFNLNTFITI